MMGYDRPLKPEWIYKTLKNIEVGTKPQDFYDAYNEIAVELTGKDGRRKTRTVLFRTFIYSFQENTARIENNILIELSKKHDFEYMKPIYMAMFVLDYEILKYFTQMFYKIFDSSQEVSSVALTKKMTETYGDTEIVKRSTRAFLKSLTYFGILEAKTKNTFEQINKSDLNIEQVADIFKLYAVVNHTKQINLKDFDKTVFAYYNTPDLTEAANKYHTEKWEYIRGIDRELLMME
ncbi:MAG: hypothetical protein L3J74_10595 [Bacteroidales bacterium]|nr:hypothetical protein [Bacteroidales bacterium]